MLKRAGCSVWEKAASGNLGPRQMLIPGSLRGSRRLLERRRGLGVTVSVLTPQPAPFLVPSIVPAPEGLSWGGGGEGLLVLGEGSFKSRMAGWDADPEEMLPCVCKSAVSAEGSAVPLLLAYAEVALHESS